jgi:hypothetical protein
VLTSLITLPLRLSLRGAELGLRVGQAVAERAIDLVGEVLAPTARPAPTDGDASPPSSARAREHDEPEPDEPEPDEPEPDEPEPGRPSKASEGRPPRSAESTGGDPRSAAASPEQAVSEQEAVAAARPVPAPPEPSPPTSRQPATRNEEDEIVDEVAEPGAEEGAGAEVRVAEPWEGYAQLKAADVIDQLTGRDAAELAAVELYELFHRQRQTVIDAAKRELRRAENSH